MTTQQNYIAGEWIASHDAAPSVNPPDTNDVIGEYARANAADAERAILAARAAFAA